MLLSVQMGNKFQAALHPMLNTENFKLKSTFDLALGSPRRFQLVRTLNLKPTHMEPITGPDTERLSELFSIPKVVHL